MEIAVVFGRVLRKQRRAAGLTQGQLAIEAELDRNYISMLELGQRQPTITTLLKLAPPLKTTGWKLVQLIEKDINAEANIQRNNTPD